ERHGDAPRAGAWHHRHQGRDRQHRARHRSHQARAAQLRDLQRRGFHRARADPARRPRGDFGDRQRGAEADAPDVRGGARRRREEGARAQPPPAAAAPAPVRRGQPDPGQVGARRDGHARIRPAAAAVAARREVPSGAARGAARGGHRAAGAARGGGPRLMRKIAVAGALALLAGCGTSLFDSKVDYKSAGTLPNLEVPPDLTAPARDTRFVVPETGKSSATLSGYQAERKEQTRAGNTAVLPQVERMHIERAGAERWLVVQDQIPEKLWPLVKDFWQEYGFLIKPEAPDGVAAARVRPGPRSRVPAPRDGAARRAGGKGEAARRGRRGAAAVARGAQERRRWQ